MTLKETFDSTESGLIGMVYILHRKYYDDRWNGERDGYMEVEIKDYIDHADGPNTLILIKIRTTFRDHHQGNEEWHDLNWCAQWEVVTSLAQCPI